MSLSVRDGKQRKRSFPLVSISEREETDCGEGTEPDGAECTADSADSAAGRVKVREAHKLKRLFVQSDPFLFCNFCIK